MLVGIASGLLVESQKLVYSIFMFPCTADCTLDISFNVLE